MSNILISWAEVIASYLIVGSVVAAILVPMAWAIIKAVAIHKPVYRHMIWLYSLLGIAMLPAIWLYGPKLKLTILPVSTESPVVVNSAPLRSSGPVVSGSEVYSPQSVFHTDSLPERTIQRTFPLFKVTLAGVWFVGFVLMLSRLVVGWCKLVGICRMATYVPKEACLVDANNHRLRIRLTSQIPGPVCFGILRPVILLPNHMYEKGTPKDIQMIVSHELAHIKRWDCLINLLQRIVEAIFFFHPFVWLASRHLTHEREQICDTYVLVQGASTDDYTNLLSQMGEQALGARRYLQTVALFEGQLLSRIRSLLDPHHSRQTKLPWPLLAACSILVLAVYLTFSSVRLAAKPNIDSNESTASQTSDVLTENTTPVEALHQATASGDLNRVKTLLDQGIDIDSKDDKGHTPLLSAIIEGHTDLAKYLIDHGADLEAKKKPGDYTPLLEAIAHNNTDIVEVLVKKGVDVNYIPKGDYSPLINAIWSKDKYNMAKLLVDRGAKFDVKDQEGWTAFRHAAEAGYHDVIKLFVAKGADISTFHVAAFMGDLDRVKEFVKQGTDVDTKDELGWTPLFWASCMGRTEVIRYLISKGANINSSTDNQSTPLHEAAHSGVEELVLLLIDKGADVSARDRRGRTPLHEASTKEIVELLIRKGADVNSKDVGAMTPLWRAASNGHTEIVEILIANGADVNTNDYQGRTALMRAKKQGHAKVVELLRQHGAKETLHGAVAADNIDEVKRLIEQGADVNEKIEGGITPLLVARDLPIVELLVSNGADINVRNSGGRTLLHLACRNGYKEVAEFLIRKGADINARDGGRMTPLWLAAGHGEVEIAEILIANGADVSATDYQGLTPLEHAAETRRDTTKLVELFKKHGAKETLHGAVASNNIGKVTRLISQGFDVNAKNARGRTPLHFAADHSYTNKEVAELLISKGADVNAKANNNRTPLHLAIRSGNKNIAELLIAKGADIDAKAVNGWTPLHIAANSGNTNMAELLVAKNADVDAIEDYGRTPLHRAVQNGKIDIVRLLLIHEANVDARDKGGVTPLGLAEENGDNGIVELLRKYGAKISVGVEETSLNKAIIGGDTTKVKSLIAAGADVNAKNNYGYSPLHVTCILAGRKDQAEILIVANADVNAKDKDGHSPLWHAQERGRTELVELLRKHGAKE